MLGFWLFREKAQLLHSCHCSSSFSHELEDAVFLVSPRPFYSQKALRKITLKQSKLRDIMLNHAKFPYTNIRFQRIEKALWLRKGSAITHATLCVHTPQR